jgi:hypothetical protein
MIRRSRVVIVICPSLQDTVRAIDPSARSVLIENAPGSTDEWPTGEQADGVRRQFGLLSSTPVVLYTGTFEAYQGLDLLFAAMDAVQSRVPTARLLMVGGKAEQVAKAREQARAAGIGEVVIFAGERPSTEIPAYLRACDALVSPRSRGTNTPLKIYQYLRSGKPIVATRLLTHTQVLSDDTAILTAARPRPSARESSAALQDQPRAARLGTQARRLAETKYSYEAYPRTDERRARRVRGATPESAAPARARKDVAERSAGSRSLQLQRLRRSGDRPSFDERRFGGPLTDGRCRAGGLSPRVPAPIRNRAVLDVGAGTGRAAILMARAGASVTASIRPRKCWDRAAAARRRIAVSIRFAVGTRTGSSFPIRRSTSSSACAC